MEAHLMQKVTPATSRRKLLDSFIFFFTSQHGGVMYGGRCAWVDWSNELEYY